MKTGKNVGFTLLELLIVVAIIGILTTILTISINASTTKSKSAAFKSEITPLQHAFLVACDAGNITINDVPDASTFSPASAVPTIQDCGQNRSGDFFVSVIPTNGASCSSADVSNEGIQYVGC